VDFAGFNEMAFINQKEFERLVQESISVLPENIKQALENVAFVIEDEPERKDMLGLYHGVPKIKRGAGYGMVLPDKITIYKRMIEDEAESANEIPALVRRVVWHEIGHHLGFEEREIRRLERKWEKEKKYS
jgi:predicted Zn-dependent protease with MMP-like domain